jgi:hypothetical protein
VGYLKVFEDYWNYHLKEKIVKILFLLLQRMLISAYDKGNHFHRIFNKVK